jgi:transglutaminase-like putative cysteine protease
MRLGRVELAAAALLSACATATPTSELVPRPSPLSQAQMDRREDKVAGAQRASPAASSPARSGAARSEPAEAQTFLHIFPVQRRADLPKGQVVLHTRGLDSRVLTELVRRISANTEVLGVEESRARIVLGDYPRSLDPVGPNHRSCSFVIDCDQPVFDTLRQQLAARYPPRPNMDQLVSYVDGYIKEKTHRNLWDIASSVARERAGDCTEHAVLLAALARMHQIAARVVVGLVLIQNEKLDVLAFGHACVEYHDGSGWRPADAALSAQTPSQLTKSLEIRYLPLRIVDGEGPDFQGKMLRGVHVLHVQKIEVAEQGIVGN